ncbi:GDSL-type esterase/lipase family protein [Clostridium sp.]|uniref:GDSL-type esterase/lipase family protein n=1 Tax=Clostridium sp. TaxID=1506 RepID=UPI003D6DA464
MKKFKLILIISLIFNILFIFVGGFVVYENGGIEYTKIKESTVINSNYPKPKTSSYYNDKVNSFKNIKKSNEIIFLGDSLTDYCNWNIAFNNTSIRNLGISGDTTSGVLNRLNDIYILKPKKLFIMIGINDLSSGKSKEDIINNYTNIVKDIQSNNINTNIFIQSILPISRQIVKKDEINNNVAELNSELKDIAEKLNVNYINLYDLFRKGNELNNDYAIDGLHLNNAGYLVWKKAIEKYVIAQ